MEDLLAAGTCAEGAEARFIARVLDNAIAARLVTMSDLDNDDPDFDNL